MRRFAELAASVFIHGDTDVYLFSKLVPTPFVSFATESIGDLGIMVTASHNPKDDNGYKVYWNKGVQVNIKFTVLLPFGGWNCMYTYSC